MSDGLEGEQLNLFPDVVHSKTPGQIALGLTAVCKEVRFEESVTKPVISKVVSDRLISQPDDLMVFLDRHLRTYSRQSRGNIPYEDTYAKYAQPIVSAIVPDFDGRQRLAASWQARIDTVAENRNAADKRKQEEKELQQSEALQMKLNLASATAYVLKARRGRGVTEKMLPDDRFTAPSEQPVKVSGNKRQRKKLLKRVEAIGSASLCRRVKLPSQLDDYWMSGVVLCSRLPIIHKQNIVISENGYAAKRGHPGLNKEVISGRVSLAPAHDLTVIVAHPSDTVHSLASRRDGIKSLSGLVHSKAYANNTLLVGDMNQWRLMPSSLRSKTKDVLHSRTGSLLKPTWRYNAYRFVPLRLNLDYVYWSKQSDFTIKNFEVLYSGLSDHRPLLASFEVL